MGAALNLPIIVNLQRYALDQLWSRKRWHASSVAIARNPAPQQSSPASHAIRQSPVAGFVPSVLALQSSLTLDRSEVPAYLINLVNGSPVLFVAVEETDTAVTLKGLTASPLALDPFDRPGIVRVDRVPMPREIIDTIRSFVDQLSRASNRQMTPLRPAY